MCTHRTAVARTIRPSPEVRTMQDVAVNTLNTSAVRISILRLQDRTTRAVPAIRISLDVVPMV